MIKRGILQKDKRVSVINQIDAKNQGLPEYEVEIAFDGNFYLKGYAPAKPQEVIDGERIAELEKYLEETDWYAIRLADTGDEIPAEIKKARQDAREEISKLRGK
ncbi:MAG: hypothetical protein UHK60_08075 [Acutalibacteraceae bacterium]|nr:hypothetical protein [Acutalibacteraceae bacterium]